MNPGDKHTELPAILAPVSRALEVANPLRSLAFYRDVLGFDVRSMSDENGTTVAELVRGPARIELRADSAERHALERGVLYLETDDVDAMHSALRERGAQPSAPADVNWIKIRMFEVRDPDGHVLWFGRSFHRPSEPRVAHMVRTIMPEMPFGDVPAAVAYYRDVLGFTINYEQHDIGVMDRDAVRLLLIARTDRHTGIGSCYLYVSDADALHAELVGKGAHVLGEPVSQPWGLREFQVLDHEGNRLSFGQPFE